MSIISIISLQKCEGNYFISKTYELDGDLENNRFILCSQVLFKRR
jgi:hypothetical protein